MIDPLSSIYGSKVPIFWHLVANHQLFIGAMVAMYQSNKENQGKQTLGSSLEAAYIGAEASLGVENARESSIFSILHGTVPDVDTVTGDVLSCPLNGRVDNLTPST